MKHLLPILLLLALCAAPVMATVYTFDDYTYPSGWFNYWTGYGSYVTELGTMPYTGYNQYSANIVTTGTGGSVSIHSTFLPSPANPSTYWAATYTGGGGYGPTQVYSWTDGSGTLLAWDQAAGNVPYTRSEYKLVGGQIRRYQNGVDQGTISGVLATNPSYFGFGNYLSKGTASTTYAYYTNVVIGGSDHHAVNGLPSNWTIIRDLINPAATGVYAWNPTTSAWVLKDSNYMYVEADTDSTDSTTSENLIITNVQYGAVVNTTVVNSAISYHNIQYNVANLLNTPTSLGVALPDGQYQINFEGSTESSTFWVISNGAAVATDKSSYLVGETAIVTTTMLPAYFDTATYDYTLKAVDVYGTTISTQTINTATQTSTVSMNQNGVTYLEVVATKKSDGTTNILGYAAVTVYEYLGFHGVTYDANTTLPLAGVAFNFTQGSTIVTGTSGYDGNYSVSTFGTGSLLQYYFNKSGYRNWTFSLTPLSTGYKTLDVALYPYSPSVSNVTIGGVLHDSVYGNIVQSATVTATNGTTISTTANIRGGYTIPGLTAGKCYQMGATKTGFLFASPMAPVCVVAA